MCKRFKWILLFAVIILILGGFFAFKLMHMALKDLDGDNPPRFIQADFVELDKVYAISKFRSGTGHDFSVGSGETCRSMKHYFSSMNPTEPNYKREGLKFDEWPYPIEGKDVTIFSPVDGKVEWISEDKNKGWVGSEIKVTPDSHKQILFRLQHVTPIDGIKRGTKVKAGQKIGLVLANQSFDIVIASMTPWKTTYISYFAAMPDEIFAKYQARGVKSREDLIFTREYIDANPWKCGGGKEQFAENYAGTPEGAKFNSIFLSGFEEMDNLLNQKYFNSKDQVKK